MKEKMMQEIAGFNLPKYQEIPNVGLFLEQTTKYISEYLEPLEEVNLTGSMISNYVKKKIIKNPVKKQYDREQIAYLIFIAVAKSVLSLEDIQLLFQLQSETYSTQRAYEYFRRELKRVLQEVFAGADERFTVTEKPQISDDESGDDMQMNRDEKMLLHNTVVTVANKVYLDKYFKLIRESRSGQE